MRLILFLLLAACTYEPTNSRTVTLTLVKTTEEVAKACGDDGILEDFGCAKGAGTNSCEIVALDVRTGYDDRDRLATWGHELRHCFFGPAHV